MYTYFISYCAQWPNGVTKFDWQLHTISDTIDIDRILTFEKHRVSMLDCERVSVIFFKLMEKDGVANDAQ